MLRSLLVVLCLLVTFFSANVYGQEEVKIGGNKFIIHHVEKGNTLYAISKTYSVPVSEILLANPELSSGLKIGQEIKVPVNSIDKNEAQHSPTLKNNFLLHKVERKETLYAISKKYGISVKTLYDYNDGLKQGGLQEGSTIKIPTTISEDADAQSLNPPQESGKRYHTVKKRETLYGLSKKFNLTAEELKKANGGLPEGLKVGQEIVIPSGSSVQAFNTVTTPEPTKPVVVQTILNSTSELQAGNLITVALMLPFNIDEINPSKNLGHDQVALEFYQGAKIAIDSLKNLGLNAKVFVYDTKKSAATVRQILARPEISEVNLFIGPLYKSTFLEVAKFSTERGIPVVCPVPQANKILLNNPNVSKVYSSDATQARWAGAYTRTKLSGANTFVITLNSAEEKRMASFFEKAAMFGTTDSLAKVIFWDKKFNVDRVKARLDLNRENVIYIPSNDIAFVMTAITNLTPLTKDYNIRIIGSEDWLKFDQAESSDLVKLHVTLPVSSHVDYTADNVKGFLQKYRSLYNTDPNQFGLLGFDVLYYYMLGYLKFGSSFSQSYPDIVFEPTSVRFRMHQIANGSGYENTGVYILEYDNLELKPVY